MNAKTLILIFGIVLFTTFCNHKKEETTNMKYSSSITFLYYNDFSYGINFFENVLNLDLVMDQGFARVYQVNQKAYVGIVQKKDSSEVSGNTLFSLTTNNVEKEYKRVVSLDVYNLTEIKFFESIPLKSFFFDDSEGHKFEIQQFINDMDIEKF